MPTLEELKEMQAQGIAESNDGFIENYGQSQEKVLKNFNTGVARFFGLPSLAADLLEAGENKLLDFVGIPYKESKTKGRLPNASDIQSFGAKHNMAFAPGEEPDDTVSRITQNIGTAAPLAPFMGAASLGYEAVSAVTGAIGGKIAEQTEWGQRHPEIARAIGELGGGLSPVGATVLMNFYSKGGIINPVIRGGKHVFGKAKGALPKKEARVLHRLREIEPSPEIARANLAKEAITTPGKHLSPSQAAGTTGMGRLGRTVEKEIPEVAEEMAAKRIEQASHLERMFKKTGDVADARSYIDAELTKSANKANIAISKLSVSKSADELGEIQVKIMMEAKRKADDIVSEAWEKLPSGEKAGGENILSFYKKELDNITVGGDKTDISAFAREKLGKFVKNKKTGKMELRGGVLFTKNRQTATAKALHQFYSRLGREREALTRQAGSANKIRIIDGLRESVMKDLDDAMLSSPYVDAISLSKDMHNKFTKGAVGKVLGFARGETPSPTKALDELIGRGGRSGKAAIAQALKGSPESSKNIQDFIKVQFAIAAKNRNNNAINVTAGKKFLKDFDEILTDLFPGLKSELEDAIVTQMDVDKLVGVPTVSQLSPLKTEKSAAAIFLKSDPGEEIRRILRNSSSDRTRIMTDLVNLTNKDTTGKAFAGIQNAFTEELFSMAKKGSNINGTTMLEKLKKFKPMILKSKLFTKADVERMEKVADAFEKISLELSRVPLSGGIINDAPRRILSNTLRIIAVRVTGKLNRFVNKFTGGGDFGGSLQTANIASNEMKAFAKSLTNDEAREALIAIVKDRKLMDQALKKLIDTPPEEQRKFMQTLFSKIKGVKRKDVVSGVKEAGKVLGKEIKSMNVPPIRMAAVVPPAASLGDKRKERGVFDQQVDALYERMESLLRK